MVEESLNITRDAGRGEDDEAQNGFTRAVDDGPARIGRRGVFGVRSRRLYAYDRDEGAAGASLKGSSDKADRLSVGEAARLLDKIHKHFDVHRQMEGFLYDFDHQMYICYTLNGGSQFTPSARVKFYVGELYHGEYLNSFEFSAVHSILGIDFRRFFRTMANDVIGACKEVIYNCDYDDGEMVEQRNQLLALAQTRDIARYPHLCADCADAATSIDSNELHAILRSKATVIAATANSVDKRTSAFPIRSADNYDSSTGTSVAAAHDIHGQRYHE